MRDSPFVKKAKVLKSLGVVSYDLRKKLHPSSKKRIERLYDEWSYTIHNKENTVRRQVSKATAKLLEKSGYSVNKKNQVFLIQEPGDRVRIRDGYVIYEREDGDTEKVLLPARGDFLSKVERLMKTPLKRNELLTLKVGEYRNVSSQFTSWKDLHKYVTTTHWKNSNVFQYLSVVSVKVGEEVDEETGEVVPVFQKRSDVERKEAPNGKAKRKGRGY